MESVAFFLHCTHKEEGATEQGEIKSKKATTAILGLVHQEN